MICLLFEKSTTWTGGEVLDRAVSTKREVVLQGCTVVKQMPEFAPQSRPKFALTDATVTRVPNGSSFDRPCAEHDE